MKRSSGGPSSASSALCSSPIYKEQKDWSNRVRTHEILKKDMHLGEIPDMKSAVSPRAGQDSLVMRGPLDLNVTWDENMYQEKKNYLW